MKKRGLFVCLLSLGGCAIDGVGPTGSSTAYKDIPIVTAFTASDAMQFREAGAISCKEDKIITVQGSKYNSTPDGMCRAGLTNRARELNADLVVIEKTESIPCAYPAGASGCVAMTGRAYKRRE